MNCFDAGFSVAISVRGSLVENTQFAELSADSRTSRELAFSVVRILWNLLSLRVRGGSLAYFANWACISSSRVTRHTVGGGAANYAPNQRTNGECHRLERSGGVRPSFGSFLDR